MELLVASTMIGVIMIGIIAVDVFMRRSQQTSLGSNQSLIDMLLIMDQINRQGQLAIGDITSPGIAVGASGSVQYACFRQDRNLPATPAVYSDDLWACFSAPVAGDFRYCTNNLPGTCQLSGEVLGTVSNRSFTFVNTPPNHYLDVMIGTLPDSSKPANPQSNPETQVRTRIVPLGHSWN